MKSRGGYLLVSMASLLIIIVILLRIEYQANRLWYFLAATIFTLLAGKFLFKFFKKLKMENQKRKQWLIDNNIPE